MDRVDQLNKWVAGESVHNIELDECCPDFSCCQPQLLVSEEERRLFRSAYLSGDQDMVDELLYMFLGAMVRVSKVDMVNVCIAGEVPDV